ncbi:MAG: type II secretion system protein F [Lachnospiraceae bacterium]|nr:type II secretion system protein F [Lachnospiraceae bacterium]
MAQMTAGYSIENSFKESYQEMGELYGEDSYICKELKIILGKLKNNISIEDSIAQLAIRSGNQDIRLFSEVLAIGKRSGGDLISIVRSAALNLAEKADAEREIRSIISEKQFEQMIMNIIPLVMISYVKLSSPEMMVVMYQTTVGRIIMSVCFVIYIAAFLLGKKIMEIEV